MCDLVCVHTGDTARKTAGTAEEQEELEKFIEADDIEGYMEKAAIEELNYAYPNERRFFDTSRN